MIKVLNFTGLLILLSGVVFALNIIDDFNDGNLNGWTVLGGNWQTTSGAAHQTLQTSYGAFSTPNLLSYQGIVPSHSFVFQADIKTASGTDSGNNAIGLAFHIQNSTNYYTIHIFPGWGGGAFRFIKVVNGSYSYVSTPGDTNMGFTPSQNSFYTMRVEATNSSYKISVWNGTTTTVPAAFQQTYTDSSFSGGTVGLWNQQGPHGYFDNVQADFNSVPEMSTLLLLSLGLICFFMDASWKFKRWFSLYSAKKYLKKIKNT